MKNKNKKIFLLLCGGTALEEKNIRATSVNKPEDIPHWLEQIAEAAIMAELEPVFICADKGLSGVDLWQKLSKEIYQRINDFEGFVVLLDVESTLSTSIALSFALENFNKPVILTGSQITEQSIKLPDWQNKKAKAYGGLGVKANLINAVQIATMNLPAVVLMFGSRIVRAVKAQRVQALGLNLFESVDDKYLGKIDFGISLTEKFTNPQQSPNLKDNFETNIKILEYFSGMDLKDLNDNKVKGKLIRNLPDLSLLDGYQGKAPVVVYNPHLFTIQKKDKVIVVNNMTWETTLIKFMWALAQKDSNVEAAMSKEYCGEFIKH